MIKMTMLVLVSNEENIIQRKIIKTITKEEKDIALSIFNEYKRKGVILSDFSDSRWEITNEVKTRKFVFSVNELLIKKQLKSCTAREFVELLKCYICFCLGQYSLELIQNILGNIKKAMIETNCFLTMPQNVKVLEKRGVSDFINIFPYADEKLIIECIDCPHFFGKRRLMAEYQSYFLFDKILDAFWSEASDCEKDLYYPIYLWWKISMVIPNRVTEFTVIPKECIYKVKSKWMLQIRRTKLKGDTGRTHGYTLNEDYKIYKYAVTDEIASMIKDYQVRTTKYNAAEIDSLFSDDMFVSLLDSANFIRAKHLNYNHMAYLLDYFYLNIIENKYGYKILSKQDVLTFDTNGELKKLNQHEIVRITLGDSRHIAMQNMLLNGCNILMAKEITGHQNADMIFHYAGNMRNLVKCRAYSLFQMSKQNEVANLEVAKSNVSMLLRKTDVSFKEVDGGLCYSAPFVLYQDCKDCFAVAGECEKCRYFSSEDSSLVIRKEQESIVDEFVERLIEWLNSTKAEKHEDEFRVMANQLAANVENLQNGYIKDLNNGVKI